MVGLIILFAGVGQAQVTSNPDSPANPGSPVGQSVTQANNNTSTANQKKIDPTQDQAKPREAKGWWAETFEIPEARWIVWAFITITLVLIGVYFAKNFREMAFGGGRIESDTSEYMTGFGKLREQGALDDEEYAQLKQAMIESETRNDKPTEPQGLPSQPKADNKNKTKSKPQSDPEFVLDENQEDDVDD